MQTATPIEALTPHQLPAQAQRLLRPLPISQPSHHVVYEFTRDPGHLHQYFILRQQVLSRSFHLEHFDGGKDDFDDVSHILVARIGQQVVGGARITASSPRRPAKLVLEEADFSLVEQLPELNLEYCKYAEFSRVVLLEEFQNTSIGLEMFRRLHERAIAMDIRYGFSVNDKRTLRVNRRMAKIFGYAFTPLLQVQIPQKECYEGCDMHLVMFETRLFNQLDQNVLHDAAESIS